MDENTQDVQDVQDVQDGQDIQEITEKEIIELVNDLNCDLFEKFEKLGEDYDGEVMLEYRTIGVASSVMFLGYQIWCSENEGWEITIQDIVDNVNKLIKMVTKLGKFKIEKQIR